MMTELSPLKVYQFPLRVHFWKHIPYDLFGNIFYGRQLGSVMKCQTWSTLPLCMLGKNSAEDIFLIFLLYFLENKI